MRVAFFGSTDFSCQILRALKESHHEVVAIVTQPDQPKGRRLTMCPTEVCSEATNLEIPILKPERIKNNVSFRRELMEQRPEAFMVASYGQIISKKTLELTEWPLNVHPSLLPELRGASPVRTTLLQGLTETGVCIMRMTPRLDDGDVMLRETMPIPGPWNFAELKIALSAVAGRLAVEALDQAAAGTATFTPQDHTQATYSSFYTRQDTEIDWTRPASELGNFVRAWDPDIGARTRLPDGRLLKIWQTKVTDIPPQLEPHLTLSPGVVIVVSNLGFWVATGDGILQIDTVQPENKPRMPAGAFLAGTRLMPGSKLGNSS